MKFALATPLFLFAACSPTISHAAEVVLDESYCGAELDGSEFSDGETPVYILNDNIMCNCQNQAFDSLLTLRAEAELRLKTYTIGCDTYPDQYETMNCIKVTGDNVMVRNGQLQGCTTGILLEGDDAFVYKLSITDTVGDFWDDVPQGFSIVVQGNSNRILRTYVKANPLSYGAVLLSGKGNLFRNNIVEGDVDSKLRGLIFIDETVDEAKNMVNKNKFDGSSNSTSCVTTNKSSSANPMDSSITENEFSNCGDFSILTVSWYIEMVTMKIVGNVFDSSTLPFPIGVYLLDSVNEPGTVIPGNNIYDNTDPQGNPANEYSVFNEEP